MRKELYRSITAAVAALVFCCLILSGAAAEGNWLDAYELPEYKPVELANPSPSPIPLDQATPYKPHADGFLPDHTGYVDGTISVRVDTATIKKTKVLFTWIQIADPSQLRTAMASPYPQKKEVHATVMAKDNDSVLATNGDCFVLRPNKEGIVYRNGALIWENTKKGFNAYDALIIDFNGDFHILRQPTNEEFKAWDGKIMHSFVFGPALVIDGQKVDLTDRWHLSKKDSWLLGKVGGFKVTQRCVICQMDKLSYLIITTEGPEQSKNGGMTIAEMSDIAYEIGAQQAFNLDGGSSSWLVLGEERINTLKTVNIKKITDIIYFITAEEGAPEASTPETEETPETPAE